MEFFPALNLRSDRLAPLDAVSSVSGSDTVYVVQSGVGKRATRDQLLAGWTGSNAITTLGTIATGVWQGTAIDKARVSGTGSWAVGEIPNLPASIITSGTITTARLGSGTADSSTYLRGDQTWATIPSGGVAIGDSPTWTGQHTFLTGAAGASPAIFRQTGGTAGVHELQIGHNGTNPIIESKSGGLRLIPPSAANFVSVQAGNNTGTQYSVRLWHDAGSTSYLDSQNSHMTVRAPAGSFVRFGNANGYIGVGVISPDGRNGGTTYSTPYTPAQITADQTAYNFGSANGGSRFHRLTSDGTPRNIYGFAMPSVVDGQEWEIWYKSGSGLTFYNESGSAAAAGNRITTSTGADVTIAAGAVVLVRYDATSSRYILKA